MPSYAYKTISSNGEIKEKKIEANSEHEARTDLMRKGIQVVSFKEISHKENIIIFKRTKKPSADEIGTVIRQLSILIKAGVPIVEGLYGLSEQASSEVLKKCLNEIAQDVSYGSSLSDALEKHQDVFPNLAVQMAKVAEAGGTLADTMSRL
ncbi:MAG: type II secretion system F family protein, partial [Armatimonadota bacterium]